MKKTTLKNALKLICVCVLALVLMQLVSILIYSLITEKALTLHIAEFVKSHSNVSRENFSAAYAHFSVPLTARILDILIPGGVLFLAGLLIDKRRVYKRTYWVVALLLTQLEHSMTSSNLSLTTNTVERVITVGVALLVGLIAIFLSTKMAGKRTASIS
jgi:hypothetical protein